MKWPVGVDCGLYVFCTQDESGHFLLLYSHAKTN